MRPYPAPVLRARAVASSAADRADPDGLALCDRAGGVELRLAADRDEMRSDAVQNPV